ncbi:MAG: tetratricopeptide repeat protein [Akkermansia sp.]|nr:tetratricopeptide repeat protein [Akkermansia sp.]
MTSPLPGIRLILLGLALVAGAPLSAQTVRSGVAPGSAASKGIMDPAEYYLTAYRLCRESEQLAAQQNYNAAVTKGNEAEKVLAGIVKNFPKWKSNLVATRRKLLAENIAVYKKKAKEAPIPTGRQPGKPLALEPTITTVPGPNGVQPPPFRADGSTDFTPANPPAGQADRSVYDALSRAQEECRRMAVAYKELNAKFEAQQKELTTARLEQQQYKDRYDKLQEQIADERAAGNKVVDSLARQLEEMEAKYRASEEARKTAEARVTELEDTLAKTQEELERVTRERDALKAENEQLRAIVELNSPEKTKALLDQNLTLDRKLKEAMDRIHQLESQSAGNGDEQAVLAQQLDEARGEADRLREEMSGIYDENMGYRRRISELTERLNNLEADLQVQAGRPVVDPALAEENQLLRDVIAKQKRTIAMQEEGRKLLIETYKQIRNQDPNTLSALQKLDEESTLDLTDAERRLMESVKGTAQGEKEATAAVRDSLEVEALANLAAKAFAKGRYTAAEQLYRTLYDSKPDHVAGLVNLGTILLYRNKCAEAVEYFTRASRLAPDLALSYYMAGISAYRLDRMEEARSLFSRTIELDPGNAEAFFYLANIEGVSGQYDRALKHFAAALKLKPGLGDAHYNMARLYAETKKIPDAARSYDRAVKNGAEPDPEFEEYLRNHPDAAKQPGADLIEEVKPEDEAAVLRREDPEMDGIIKARDADKLPAAEQPKEGEGAQENPEETEEEFDLKLDGPSFEDLLKRVQTPVREAPDTSPAGRGHETDASRFSTVRVSTRAGGYRHKVKLRLKKPEPQRFRTRGGEIEVPKK